MTPAPGTPTRPTSATSSPIAVDTSVAIPLVVRRHRSHAEVVVWWRGRWRGRELSLAGHALVETYSVLTRLPGEARLSPEDAERLIAARFAAPLLLPAATARRVPSILARRGIAGGAVYDALVGLAAAQHGRPLATRDARARPTYEALGVEVIVAG